jgi:hypothetical protein
LLFRPDTATFAARTEIATYDNGFDAPSRRDGLHRR